MCYILGTKSSVSTATVPNKSNNNKTGMKESLTKFDGSEFHLLCLQVMEEMVLVGKSINLDFCAIQTWFETSRILMKF